MNDELYETQCVRCGHTITDRSVRVCPGCGAAPQTPHKTRLGSGYAVERGDYDDVCPLCGIHRQNAGFLRATCGANFTEPGCFVYLTNQSAPTHGDKP